METLFIGQNAIYLLQTESTNSYAIQLLKNVNPPEGTVVYTADQTHGRGQRGNSWDALPGLNIALSYILKPTFLNANKLFYLYIISALSVHDLMAELLDPSQFDIKIKWPNDILVNSKKIAGILNENAISNTTVNSSIIGIGININQTDFSESINATSLKILTKRESKPEHVLKLLNRHFENYYLKLKNGNFDSLLKAYYNNFYKRDEITDFNINKQSKKLLVKGINDQGLLHLRDSSDKDYFYDIKEVKWN